MRLTHWLAFAALVSCAPGTPALAPAVRAVTLSEAEPPNGFVELGLLNVVSGKGCGVLGTSGSREEADSKLRLAASNLGAGYVRITGVVEPRPNHECMEHEYRLSGIAYRADDAPAPATAATALPITLQDFEGNSSIGKPSPTTETSSVSLTLVPGEASENALSVTYTCSGNDEQRARLDVWTDARATDWTGAGSLTLKIKPDAALSLSVSFMDGNHTGYTQQTDPLTPGTWQSVVLPLYKFWHNPFGPPGDKPGAPVDLAHVSAFGFAPRGCTTGHFLIDDITLTSTP